MISERKILLILNPTAGAGRARAVVDEAVARLRAADFGVTVQATTSAGDASRLAAAAADRKSTRLNSSHVSESRMPSSA